MEEQEGIESLLYELSSDSRLSIIRELNENDLTMTGVAGKLDLTTTETSRQLQRLSNTFLVQKQSDGTYSVTHYGRLVLHFCSHLEFVSKHREYFLTHDVWGIPTQFLSRLGELSGSTLSMNVMGNINAVERIISEAEEFIWMGGVEEPLNIDSALMKLVPKGVRCKLLFLERFLPKEPYAPEIARGIESRLVDSISVSFVMTEKEAGLAFCLIGGKADYTGFLGKDPVFLNYVRDLFLNYWEKGK